MPARRKPGRPLGSKTFPETPAVKRARVFLEKRHAGFKPNAAAKAVAADWQVAESTVFKDYERHLSRLIDSGISDALSQTARPDLERLAVKAEAAADVSRRRLQELKIKIGREFLRDHPDIAARVAEMLHEGLAHSGTNAVHAYDFSGDEWLIVLGEFRNKLLSRSRERTTEADGLHKALAAFLVRSGQHPQDVPLDVLH